MVTGLRIATEPEGTLTKPSFTLIRINMVLKIKIGTLNVKGLNNMEKAHRTLTLLKSYHLDIIMLQETNLESLNTRNFLQQQWGYSSYWTSKTAILISNSNISLTKTQNSHNGRVIVAELTHKKHPFKLTNV
jgi:exonuclease III